MVLATVTGVAARVRTVWWTSESPFSAAVTFVPAAAPAPEPAAPRDSCRACGTRELSSFTFTRVTDVPASATRPTARDSSATATTFWDSRALPDCLAGPTRSPTAKVAEAQSNSKVPAGSTRMRLSAELAGTRATFASLRWRDVPRNFRTKFAWVTARDETQVSSSARTALPEDSPTRSPTATAWAVSTGTTTGSVSPLM